ncbi:hypothetical protein J0910_07625 [Nocardiopsis sp. CNT-189]|uniref:hypothetical protein n=1 Tax=Nocardiopsis oceanisediminis TaxID=2816862 RepID=UPI003B377405
MSPTHPGAGVRPGSGPSRPFTVFGLLAAVSAVVIAAVLIAPAVHPVVRANEAHIVGDEELMLQLLSFGHETRSGEPATAWAVEIVNGTGRDIPLTIATGCRVGFPPRRTEPLHAPEKVTVSPDEAHTRPDGCTGLAAGERFFYTVRFLDGQGGRAHPPVTFIGKSPPAG